MNFLEILDDIYEFEKENVETVLLDDTLFNDGDNVPPHQNSVDPLFTADQLDSTNEQLNITLSGDDGAVCSKDIDRENLNKSKAISPSSFVVVELLYNNNSKKETKNKFIAQVQKIVGNDKINPSQVKRGKYIFNITK
ncbi:hypothetical protein ACJJTC_007860 [Scirpophaga incertulas]